MITRYVPLGLLCILLFLGCTTAVIKENSIDIESSIDIDSQINLLIDEYKDQPAILINKISSLLKGDDFSYNPLLARLELSIGLFNESIDRVKAIPSYDSDIDNLKIVLIAKMSLREDYELEISQILKIDPYDSFVNNLISRSYLDKGELSKAEKVIDTLIKNNRESGDSYILLGDITLEKVNNLNISNKKVLNSREEKIVTSLYTKALDFYLLSDQQNSALYFVKLSSVYRKLGKKLEAVQALDSAIEIDPNDPWNYFDRGKLYFYMSSNEKALEDFKSAYSLNPSHFFSNVFLGRLYFSEGLIDDSLFHYKKVMDINPKYYPAYKDLSVLYFIKKDNERSINYITELYKTKTDRDPLLPLYLVNSLLEVDREEDAKKILQNLVKYEKNSTIKGIYYYYLDPDRAGDQALNDALLLEDQNQRMRLTYYVSCALYRGGVFSLSEALLNEVADSNIGLESKLAKYKLGVKHE